MENGTERPRAVHLTNTQPGHNKEYFVKLEPVEGGWMQTSVYGPIGGRKAAGTSMKAPGTFAEALRAFDKLVNDKRTKSGYELVSDSWADADAAPAPSLQANVAREDTGLRPMLLDETTAEQAAALLRDPLYWLQPKRDGERTLIIRKHQSVLGAQRQGLAKPLPQSVVEAVLSVKATEFILDGELVGDTLCAFDLLELNGLNYRLQPYHLRLRALGELVATAQGGGLELIATYRDEAAKKAAFERFQAERIEGVVFKLWRGAYNPGTRNGNFKHKFWKTASCIVTQVNTDRASVRVGLYDDAGVLQDVGAISVNGNRTFAQVGAIVEVKYLYVLRSSNKLYQAGILRVRDDVDTADCSLARQLQYRGAA